MEKSNNTNVRYSPGVYFVCRQNAFHLVRLNEIEIEGI